MTKSHLVCSKSGRRHAVALIDYNATGHLQHTGYSLTQCLHLSGSSASGDPRPAPAISFSRFPSQSRSAGLSIMPQEPFLHRPALACGGLSFSILSCFIPPCGHFLVSKRRAAPDPLGSKTPSFATNSFAVAPKWRTSVTEYAPGEQGLRIRFNHAARIDPQMRPRKSPCASTPQAPARKCLDRSPAPGAPESPSDCCDRAFALFQPVCRKHPHTDQLSSRRRRDRTFAAQVFRRSYHERFQIHHQDPIHGFRPQLFFAIHSTHNTRPAAQTPSPPSVSFHSCEDPRCLALDTHALLESKNPPASPHSPRFQNISASISMPLEWRVFQQSARSSWSWGGCCGSLAGSFAGADGGIGMTSPFRRGVLEATWHGSQGAFDHVLLLSFQASPRASLIAMICAWNGPNCNQRSAVDRFYRIILRS